VRLEPTKPGLTFDGLRHSHKTWMIADGVPKSPNPDGWVTSSAIGSKTYSHVAAEVEHRLFDALNDRWDKAVADSPDQPAWRI
jgi:hypothetical protein